MRIALIIFLSLIVVQTGQAQRFRNVADRNPSRPATLRVMAYPEHLAGRKMVGGGIYNPNGLTAAHASMAFGTMLELTAQSTGRSVMVTVTDRGSGVDSSLIISEAAMRRLGLLPDEVGLVTVKVWDADKAPGAGVSSASAGPSATERPRDHIGTGGSARTNPNQDHPSSDGSAQSASASMSGKPSSPTAVPTGPPRPPASATPQASLPKRTGPAPKAQLFAVQLGSYSDKGTAKSVAAKLDNAWIQPATMENRTVHRVFYGRYSDRAEADAWQARLATLGFPGYVRTLETGN